MPKTITRTAELEKRLPGAERNVVLAPYTTFKIGGPADYFYHARTPDGLVKAITTARELEIPYFLLGLGANILLGDKSYRGLVIHSEVVGIEFVDATHLRADAG